MKRVFIIHGWEAAPDMHWYPWLEQELQDRGFETQTPAMPDTDNPSLVRWLERMRLVIGDVDAETYFVGHSLGCITIMKFLEQLPHGQRAGGAVFVAGFPQTLGYDELTDFFVTPLNFARVRKAARAFTAVHSDNDPDVPIENGYIIRNELAAKLMVVPEAGHFCEEDRVTELPLVLNELLAMAGKP